MVKVGDKVDIPWWERDSSSKLKRVPNLTGTIQRINGAYVYIKVDNNPKYDVLEMYEYEFNLLVTGG